MTTPSFVPTSNALNDVRYYTQFDPYYFTVDNRPIGDLDSNVGKLSSGVDAARRAVLFSAVNRDIKDEIVNGTASNFISGFTPSFSGLDVTIDRGILFTPLFISNNYANPEDVILKQAFLHKPTTFTLTAPPTSGNSKVYTVEARYVDISGTTDVNDNYFIDTSNASFFEACINGVIELNLNVGGAEATTGNEIAPATTPGYIPLVNFHVTNGASTPYAVEFHASAPAHIKGQSLNHVLDLKLPGTAPATQSTVAEFTPVFTFADGATSSVIALLNLNTLNINKYRNVYFDFYYTATGITGNFATQLSFNNYTVGGDSINNAIPFFNNIETIPSPASSGTVAKASVSAVILGRYLNDSSQDMITIRLSRIGTDGGDTSTDSLQLIQIVARQ